MRERQRGLGRGLGALIPTDVPRESVVSRPSDVFFEGTRKLPRDLPPTDAPENRDNRPLVRPESAAAFTKAFAGLPRRDAATAATVEGEHHRLGAVPVSTGDTSGHTTGHTGSGSSVTDSGQPGAEAAAEPGAATGTEPDTGAAGLKQVPGATFAEIPLDSIRPNARQPRTVFDEQELEELVSSIQEIGILQPIVVRRTEDESAETEFELIMGERRWRASRQAGLEAIPAIIKSTPDDAMLRDALLENLQRAQLNPLEEAAAYQQLLDDFGCTHDELATRLSRSRPQISNTLRLLRLPPVVARRVAAGVLTAGHARALLGLSDAAAMERLAQRIVAEGLSVRSVEEIVAVATDESVPSPRRPRARAVHPEFDDLAALLTDRLDTRVSINMGRSKGKLTVEFASREDLDRILTVIRDAPELGASEGVA